MKTTVADKVTDLFHKSEAKHYSKGQIITLGGDDPEGVALLVDGIVEQYDITPEGSKVTVNIFKPSAFFPMSWAINKTPNSYFFSALTDVTLKYVDAERAVEFLQKNPDVTFDLLSRVYKGTDALLQRLVIAASGLAVDRLIFELLIEGYRFGTPTKNGHILVSIQQTSLASRSGLARETVSRELHNLEQENCLSLKREGILIDEEKLRNKIGSVLAK